MCIKKSTNFVYENHLVLSRTNFVELKDVEHETKELWRKFGLWYQKERENAGKTQEEVSKVAGIHVKTISRIENGEPTKRGTVTKLAEAVGIDKVVALNKAGFDVPKELTAYPQTAEELTEALKKYGIKEWKVSEKDLDKLSPEFFQGVLESIEMLVKGKLQKLEEGEVIEPKSLDKVA